VGVSPVSHDCLFLVQLVEDVLVVSLSEIGCIVQAGDTTVRCGMTPKSLAVALSYGSRSTLSSNILTTLNSDMGLIVLSESKLWSCQACILQQNIQARELVGL
jgi:hypothetical protein